MSVGEVTTQVTWSTKPEEGMPLATLGTKTLTSIDKSCKMLRGSNSSDEELELPSMICHCEAEVQAMVYCAAEFPVFLTPIEKPVLSPGWAETPTVPDGTTSTESTCPIVKVSRWVWETVGWF